MPLRTLFLCGGGTGGHVYPALAVAAELADLAPASVTVGHAPAHSENMPHRPADRWQAVYIGSIDGMEAGLVAKESTLPFRGITAAALRGRSPVAMARNTAAIARGMRQAQRLIKQERPSAILGTGGYVCVPLFLAARWAGVPTIIYLPDVVPGLAVRLLARLATVVACNVEDSIGYLRFGNSRVPLAQSQIDVVGYPVRQELFEQDRAACRATFGLDEHVPALLVYGGSRGARSINTAIAALLPHVLPLTQIIHVCGREGDEIWLREAAEKLPEALQKRYKLFPYLFSGAQHEAKSEHEAMHPGNNALGDQQTPSMIAAFCAADLAVCRSGASTLAELPAAKLPAVLVPYPYVHQEENAEYLVRRGAAVLVKDEDMLGPAQPEEGPLFRAIQQLLSHPEERRIMSERSATLARPDAASRLTNLLVTVAQSTEARP